jgi:uncharacterized protein
VTTDTLVVVFVAVIMVIGLAGTILPILPGLWLIWAAALGYGLVADFGAWGWVAMALITALAAAGTASAIYIPQRTASSIGVPWWGQLLALTGAVGGFFLVPVVGAPLGFVAGILLVTLVRERQFQGALEATWATLKSMLLASGMQFASGLGMIALWVLWAWAV